MHVYVLQPTVLQRHMTFSWHGMINVLYYVFRKSINLLQKLPLLETPFPGGIAASLDYKCLIHIGKQIAVYSPVPPYSFVWVHVALFHTVMRGLQGKLLSMTLNGNILLLLPMHRKSWSEQQQLQLWDRVNCYCSVGLPSCQWTDTGYVYTRVFQTFASQWV